MKKICTRCRTNFSAGDQTFDCTRCRGKIYSDSEALARLDDLAHVLAYEASVVSANVEGYARVPKGVLQIAGPQAERMRQTALSLAAFPELPHAEKIDAIDDLERRLRHEADFVEEQLAFSGFQSSRRRFAEAQAARLRLFAEGADPNTRVVGYHARWRTALKTLQQTAAV